MNKLEKILSYTVQNGDCLEWTRCYNSDGYPRMGWNGNSNGKVHRIVMELLGNDIEGLVVRHKCDNPKCINPDHLVVGTPIDNVKDMDDRDRRYRKITKEIVTAVMALWDTKQYSKTDIAKLLNMDPRRVGDITSGKRDQDGRIIRR